MAMPLSHLVPITMLLAVLWPIAVSACITKENFTVINTGLVHRSSTTTFHPPPRVWTTSLPSGFSTVYIVASSAYATTSSAFTNPSNAAVPPINAPSNQIALVSLVISALTCAITLVNTVWSNKKKSDPTADEIAKLRTELSNHKADQKEEANRMQNLIQKQNENLFAHMNAMMLVQSNEIRICVTKLEDRIGKLEKEKLRSSIRRNGSRTSSITFGGNSRARSRRYSAMRSDEGSSDE
ncbi:hypothetical protein B0O99DRAFT_747800 [Bisporella sp. PMI_857]|nr:hypothetical protein B0O99DRAFT_747800 [Bisporella sp. PMI_857]